LEQVDVLSELTVTEGPSEVVFTCKNLLLIEKLKSVCALIRS